MIKPHWLTLYYNCLYYLGIPQRNNLFNFVLNLIPYIFVAQLLNGVEISMGFLQADHNYAGLSILRLYFKGCQIGWSRGKFMWKRSSFFTTMIGGVIFYKRLVSIFRNNFKQIREMTFLINLMN